MERANGIFVLLNPEAAGFSSHTMKPEYVPAHSNQFAILCTVFEIGRLVVIGSFEQFIFACNCANQVKAFSFSSRLAGRFLPVFAYPLRLITIYYARYRCRESRVYASA